MSGLMSTALAVCVKSSGFSVLYFEHEWVGLRDLQIPSCVSNL
jgi:hypothetical protein